MESRVEKCAWQSSGTASPLEWELCRRSIQTSSKQNDSLFTRGNPSSWSVLRASNHCFSTHLWVSRGTKHLSRHICVCSCEIDALWWRFWAQTVLSAWSCCDFSFTSLWKWMVLNRRKVAYNWKYMALYKVPKLSQPLHTKLQNKAHLKKYFGAHLKTHWYTCSQKQCGTAVERKHCTSGLADDSAHNRVENM